MANQKYSSNELFGIGSAAKVWELGDINNPFVPEKDEGYQFREESLQPVLYWMHMNRTHGDKDSLFLTGPTGSGKSSLILQVAARLGIPVQRVNGHRYLEIMDLYGRMSIIGGDTMFIDGPLTTAYKEGHLFLLDEIDLINPGTNAGLNTVLDYAPITIAEDGGIVIPPAPGFGFIATGNSAGNGDEAGAYTGTTVQNGAFMDRFMVVNVDYPTPETEIEIINTLVPGLPSAVVDGLVHVANRIRELYLTGTTSLAGGPSASIEVTMSTRTLLRWAKMVLMQHQAKFPDGVARHTLRHALSNRASKSSAEAIDMIANLVLGDGQ